MTKTIEGKQLKRIKLNITNIRSTLVDANKTLASLRAEKELLIKKQIEEKKLKDKEAKMEKKSPSTAIGKFIDSPIKSAKSFVQKLVQLASTVLIGQLISTWPKLQDNFNTWKENNKAIIDGVVKTFTIIGSGITGFVKWIGGINTSDIDQRTAQLDKETDTVMKNVDVVAQEADDALSMTNQKDETSGTPDNDNDTKETKTEKDINKDVNKKDKKPNSKKDAPKPNLSGGGTPDTSGDRTFPAKTSTIKTPNSGVIKGLTRNQIDSILSTPSGEYSPIANVRVTDKLKSEVRQHLTSASLKSVSRQKKIDTLNSKPTGNGKGKTTILVATQTKEQLVPVSG
tara:strand:+ start:209 stop:1234 length:1026 start_codon:yes stop_codon:yes gene_type:complete